MTRLRRGRSEARVPATVRDFCLPQIVRTGTGVHPARYSVGTDSFIAGGAKRLGREADYSRHPVPSSDLTSYRVFMPVLDGLRARGGVVIKALRYKAAGRGFDSRWCHWNFAVT